MIALGEERANDIFISGDLGFMALEQVSEKYRERFINVGVSEQNMISVAAGLAYEGFIPWVYSIAPFAILRPYEQIRNDVCLHNLPVKIVGNGGGYGYGIMGATHHTLEDIAVMRVLPNMRVYVPLVSSDVDQAVRAMADDPAPNYLRLNLAAKISGPVEEFSQWRKIKEGKTCVLVSTGPVVGNVFDTVEKEVLENFEIWSVGIFPVRELPQELVKSISTKKRVVTVEEHFGQCGLNETLARLLLENIAGPIKYGSIAAAGYPSGKYGSQRWHQEENGLAGSALNTRLKELLHD
jgi:transketolase